MTKIRDVVESIIFRSPATGYTILKYTVNGYKDLIPVVGMRGQF